MSQENEYDIRDQRKILILEMSTNPGGEVVTQILLHSVIKLIDVKYDVHAMKID